MRLDWEVGALLLVEQNHDVWPVRPVHCPTGSRVRECKQQQQAAQETFLQCEIPMLLTLSFSKLSPFHICSQLKKKKTYMDCRQRRSFANGPRY